MITDKARLLALADVVLHTLIKEDLLWATEFPHKTEVRNSWLVDLSVQQQAAAHALEVVLNSESKDNS